RTRLHGRRGWRCRGRRPSSSGDALPDPTSGHMRIISAVLAPPQRLARRVVAVWRRSLQVRVVTGTLVLSAVVTAFAGWILLRQVTEGLLDAKIAASLAEASAGFRTAQAAIDAAEPTGDPSE